MAQLTDPAHPAGSTILEPVGPERLTPTTPAPGRLHLLLTLDAESAAILKRDAASLLMPERRGVTRKMRRTYWDTVDHKLGRAGLAVAVQTAGQKRTQLIQDIRSLPAAGRIVGAYEVPLAQDGLDLTRLAFIPGIKPSLVGTLPSDMLVPAFAIDLTRTVWRATLVDAVLSVTLEQADIEAAAGRLSLIQLDIAPLDGDAEAVYRLARKLIPAFDFGLASLDSAQTGYALATQSPWSSLYLRSDDDTLKPDMSVRAGILRIGRLAAATIRVEINRLIDHPTIDHVHQSRVALRRLRSLLSVFQDVIPPTARRQFSRSLSALAETLGEAREWDVLIADTIEPLRSALGPEPVLAGLQESATAARTEAEPRIRDAAAGPDRMRLALALGSWFDAEIWPDIETPLEAELLDRKLIDFATSLLKKRHRRFLQAGKSAAEADPDSLHQLRIQAKKLRYTADFLRSLYPAKPARRYIDALKGIQEILGRGHDASVAQSLVPALATGDAHADARAAGLIAGWGAAEAAASRRLFAAAWSDFTKTKRFW
jgi:CHAD domain-containing protein